MRINAGDEGLDYLGLVPVELIPARFRFVGLYFKAPGVVVYAQQLIASGRGYFKILEHGQTDAVTGGAALGVKHANEAIALAHAQGDPPGTIIVLTNDTSLTADGAYMAAGLPLLHEAGFVDGTYAGKLAVQDTINHGWTPSFIHRPGASSWGEHPQTHARQFPSDRTTIPGYSVDRNVAVRAFTVIGPPDPIPAPSPPPSPQEVDMPVIVTNAEARTNEVDGQPYGPHKFVFVVEAGGVLRHVSGVEGQAYAGVDLSKVPAVSNTDLDGWPKWAATAPPVAAVGALTGDVDLALDLNARRASGTLTAKIGG